MARRMEPEAAEVFRAVIHRKHPARPANDRWQVPAEPAYETVSYVGPYTTHQPAAAAISAAHRADRYGIEVDGYVERGEITWKRVEK